MLGYFGGFWDTWYAGHKVTFDAANKLIHINQGVTYLNCSSDIYSDWKEWMTFSENVNAGFPIAISSVGGDPISDTEKLGATYFLENGWKIKPWAGHSAVVIEGNLYTRDGSRPIVKDALGVDAVSLKVSALTSTIIVDVGADVDADAPVWQSAAGITNVYQNGSTINIAWGRATDKNPVSYNIYISKFSHDVFEATNLLTNLDGYFYTLRGLDNENFIDGTTYYIGVRATDIYGNETTNTNTASVTFDAPATVTVDNAAIATAVWSNVDRTLTTNVSSLDETDIHNALDSYLNKDDWKATAVDLSSVPAAVWTYTTRALTQDVGLDETGLHAALDSYANKSQWTDEMTAAEMHAALDSYVNKGDWKDANTAAEIHAALDSYLNKDQWKADVSALNNGVNVTKVNGVPVINVGDFRITEEELHNYLNNYANKGAWKADVSSINLPTENSIATSVWSSASRTLTDGFTSTDRAKLNSIENFDDTALTVAVGAIPTNPLLSTDTRLSNLDAKISTRAVPADVNVDNGFTALDRTKLNSLSNYDDESLLDALALVETAVVAGQITPADVWNHTTRTLTQQVSLSTAESQHLLGLANYDDTTLMSKVNAIPLDTLRTTDIRLNKLDANISSRAKPTDLQVTFDNGFTDSDRLVLNAIENYSDAAVKSLISTVDTKVTAVKAHTDTLSNYTSLAADLDAYGNKNAWKADTSGISAINTKVTSIESKVDAIDTSLDATALHTALDTYPNKSQWKAVFNPTDLTPVLNAIAALNNLSLLDIEGSTVLAKQATLNSIVTAIAAIPTTDSVADLSPVLAAIANLNDITPAEVRAAFNAADFKDKNTQAEIHAWLDSYANKDNWKADVSNVAEDVWSKVV